MSPTDKPPAFQLYVKAWMSSTAMMSLDAQGAYMRLLCWSWDNGPLPKSEDRLSRLLGLSPARFRRVWVEFTDKWVATDVGLVNLRLEQQREDLDGYTTAQSTRGKAGAAKRWGRHGAGISASNATATTQAMLVDSSSSSPSDLEIGDPDIPNAVPHADTARAREGTDLAPGCRTPQSSADRSDRPLIDGRDQRRHGNHRWCSHRDGLCVPFFLHMEFIGKSQRSDADLMAWYVATVAAYEGQPIGEDSLKFWRNNFAHWIGAATEATWQTQTDRAIAGARRTMAAIDRGEL